MKTISQLLFLLEDLLTVGKLVAKLNVLKSVLVHFCVLGIVSSLPIVNATSRQSFTSPTKHGVLSYGAFEFLKLMFNLFTLSLLFIKFSL